MDLKASPFRLFWVLFGTLLVMVYPALAHVFMKKGEGVSPEDTYQHFIEHGEKLYYSDVDSMRYFFKQALDVAQANNLDRENIGFALNGIGRSYYMEADYPRALNYFQEALVHYEEGKVQHRIPGALNNIGLIFAAEGEYDRAEEMHRRALSMGKELNDSSVLSINYLNIGIIHLRRNHLDSAEWYYNQSIAFSIERAPNYAMAVNRLGEIALLRNNLEHAENLYKEVVDYKGYGADWEWAAALEGLGVVRTKQGRLDEAVVHLKKSVEMFTRQNALWDIAKSYESLAKAYSLRGDAELAYKNLEESVKYRNIYLDEKRIGDLNYMMRKLEEMRSKELEQQAEIQDHKIQIRNILLLGFFIMLAIMVFALFFAVQKNQKIIQLNHELEKQNEEIQRKNEEINRSDALKARILSVISHDIRSPINSISQVLALSREGILSESERSNLLENLNEDVHSLSYTLNNLLHWAAHHIKGEDEEKETVDVNRLVREEMKFWRHRSESKKITIIPVLHESPVLCTVGKQQINIIVRNLLGNAIKFTPENGTVHVLTSHNVDDVRITIRDSGMGMDQRMLDEIRTNKRALNSLTGTENEKGTGIGLLLSWEFAIKNNGYIEVESDYGVGTSFTLVLRKEESLDDVYASSGELSRVES